MQFHYKARFINYVRKVGLIAVCSKTADCHLAGQEIACVVWNSVTQHQILNTP